eukprot:NODE_2133_length_1197_cov_6.574913_g1768_i0.p1 GENE.NODE_2133_length_1197_cov_6.574913_g1768_i0~~NODE_2133_length_1197_cov_6.574913_g1768_i0.p1  ORF type:complete len:340 (+),score=84.71 NODE_2133_length_1197_cov_6.574913_g1768_i0:59-1021(+)
MINTPQKSGGLPKEKERGYDFLSVVRWFACRADVILLLFDPNNPGTTGETLDVLTESLAGQDHKFLIMLNKVDQFTHIHDFARAYGTLCWNLAKVIPRKDLPRIYPLFTPVADFSELRAGNPIPLTDFEANRHEVVGEVLRAPLRRLDNIVTTLEETALRVTMAGAILNKIKHAHSQRLWAYRATATAAVVAPASLFVLMLYMGVPPLASLAVWGLTLGFGAFSAMSARKNFLAHEKHLILHLDELFQDEYFRDLATGNDDVQARWALVKRHVLQTLKVEAGKLHTVPTVSRRTLSDLQAIVKKDVPQLRSKTAKLKDLM